MHLRTRSARKRASRASAHPSTRRTSTDIDTHSDLETKAGIPLDAVVTHGDLMRAFESFKETNDQRLGEKRADVLLEEKLVRINTAIDAQTRRLDDMALKGSRPVLGAERGTARNEERIEHKAAFEFYVRNGEASGLRTLELKALSVGSSTDGGYLVPAEVETAIGERLTAISPIRSIAGQMRRMPSFFSVSFSRSSGTMLIMVRPALSLAPILMRKAPPREMQVNSGFSCDVSFQFAG